MTDKSIKVEQKNGVYHLIVFGIEIEVSLGTLNNLHNDLSRVILLKPTAEPALINTNVEPTVTFPQDYHVYTGDYTGVVATSGTSVLATFGGVSIGRQSTPNWDDITSRRSTQRVVYH